MFWKQCQTWAQDHEAGAFTHGHAQPLPLTLPAVLGFYSLSPFCFGECAVVNPSGECAAATTMSTGTLLYRAASDGDPRGTGDRFASAVLIVAGVAALVASIITFVSVSIFPCPAAPTDVVAEPSGYKRA